jgi:hypothetical protein
MRIAQASAVAGAALTLIGCGSGQFDEAWVNGGGKRLSRDVVSVAHGTGDCFGGVTVLHLGWPPGKSSHFTIGPTARQYIRDPDKAFPAHVLAARFSDRAALPEDARNTGFRSGEWRLWIAADGRAVFLVGDRRVERWPWNKGGLACV